MASPALLETRRNKRLSILTPLVARGATLEEIGRAFNVSRERARQILCSFPELGATRTDAREALATNGLRAKLPPITQAIAYRAERSGCTVTVLPGASGGPLVRTLEINGRLCRIRNATRSVLTSPGSVTPVYRVRLTGTARQFDFLLVGMPGSHTMVFPKLILPIGRLIHWPATLQRTTYAQSLGHKHQPIWLDYIDRWDLITPEAA